MAQGVPASQPKPWRDGDDIISSGDEGAGLDGDEGIGEDEVSDERVAAAWGKPSRAVGGEYRKRRRPREDEDDAGLRDEDDDPELAEFFGDIPPAQQIAICRAYASYLAAQHRGKIASSRAGAAYPRRQSKG